MCVVAGLQSIKVVRAVQMVMVAVAEVVVTMEAAMVVLEEILVVEAALHF